MPASPPSGRAGIRSGSTTTCWPTRAIRPTRSSRAGRRCPPLAAVTEPCPARAARGRQHVPQPGTHRQARDDRRPRVRRPTRPRARRRLVRARARRLRDRLRRRLRRAARPARRGGRAHPAAARRRARHATRAGSTRCTTRCASRDPIQRAPADPDRRIRADEDAPHDRSLRRHVERLRPTRADRGNERDPAPALRRRRAGRTRRSSGP